MFRVPWIQGHLNIYNSGRKVFSNSQREKQIQRGYVACGSAQNRQWQGWKIWIHVAPTRKLPLVTTVRQRVLFWYLPQSFPTTFALVTQKLGVQGLSDSSFPFSDPCLSESCSTDQASQQDRKRLDAHQASRETGPPGLPSLCHSFSMLCIYCCFLTWRLYVRVDTRMCLDGAWSVYFYPSLLFPYYLTGSYFVCFWGIYSIFYSTFITKLSALSH